MQLRSFPVSLRLAALALLCCGGVVSAQSSLTARPDAEALLEDASRRYADAKSFYFVASEQTTTAAAGQQRDTFNTVVTARDAEGRFRVEFDDRVTSSSVVSDGGATWAYMPQAGKFAKLPAGQFTLGAQTPGPDFEAMTRRYIDRYRSLSDRLLQATILDEETLPLQSGEAQCYKVQAAYNPPPGMRDGSIQRVYWIDQDSGLVVREQAVASMLQPNATTRVTVTQQIAFQIAAAGDPVDPELFVFTPPPGAQEVESFREDAPGSAAAADAEAPDFTLENVQGAAMQLSKLRGKVVLLDFWATWCGPCRYDMPHVQALYEELGDRGFAVLGVNAEPRERAQAYLDENGFAFPSLVDVGMRVAALYRVRAIPTFVVVDRQGRIASYMQGTRTREQLREAILAAGL